MLITITIPSVIIPIISSGFIIVMISILSIILTIMFMLITTH